MTPSVETTPPSSAQGAMAEGDGRPAIRGRSPGQIAWMRLRRDKAALAGGIVVLALSVIALIGPLFVPSPYTFHPRLIDPTFSRPNGPFGGISLAHPLGVEPLNGRDMLARVVVGARYSLLIGFLASALAVTIGVLMGIIAGYFGGWADAVIARAMDIFLAFPLLVFAIALVGVIPGSAFGLSGNTLRVALLVFIIGFFAWPFMGRIIRGQTISLRERDFVDAARSLGARGPSILFRELLPNLAGPILVYADAAHPGEHLVRGGTGLPRRRDHPAHAKLGADAVRRSGAGILQRGPDVHGHSRPGDLHHRPGVQPLRRRAPRCPGSAKHPVGHEFLPANT